MAGFAQFATALGKLADPPTPAGRTPSTTPGTAGTTGGSKSLSAAQFGKMASRTAEVGDAGRNNALPSLSDPSYTPSDDVPNGLYST